MHRPGWLRFSLSFFSFFSPIFLLSRSSSFFPSPLRLSGESFYVVGNLLGNVQFRDAHRRAGCQERLSVLRAIRARIDLPAAASLRFLRVWLRVDRPPLAIVYSSQAALFTN